MDYVKTVESAVDDLIDNIHTAQDWTVTAIERVAKAFGASRPNFRLPLPIDLPRSRAVAESAFRLWGRVIENQKEMTLRLLDAIEPVNGAGKKNA